MSELLSKLGIDWRLLIAQLINFLILLFVLRRFAYKPILLRDIHVMVIKRANEKQKIIANMEIYVTVFNTKKMTVNIL